MAIVQQSRTERFILQYDDQIAPAQRLAQTLAKTIETDFHILRRYLPFDQGASPDAFQRRLTSVIFVDASSAKALNLNAAAAKSIPGRGGARIFTNRLGGGAATIWLNAFGATNQPLTPDFATFLFIAEMSEQLMGSYGWDPASSRGEALSRALAEEFQPGAGYAAECISTAPWVNGWLNSAPRFDYLGKNPSPTSSNALLGTDLDGLGYGCGVLFINYLRYQLGHPLEAICQAGGTTWVDTYKRLTGRNDDPLAALTALIAKHYDGSIINLRDNNPFPLLDNDARFVSFGFQDAASVVPSPGGTGVHIAHASPFFTCPEKDYSYWRAERVVTWTIKATALGFAVPQFKWKVNNQELPSSSGAMNVPVTYDVPDPDHPRTPKPGSGTARFTWTDANTIARGPAQNALALTNGSFAGVYHMHVSVEVTETYTDGAATVVGTALDFQALHVVYEPQYYKDGVRCANRFESGLPALKSAVDIVVNHPDPADGSRIAAIVRGVDVIRAEIGRIGERDPRLAMQAVEYAAVRLQINPNVVLGTSQTVG